MEDDPDIGTTEVIDNPTDDDIGTTGAYAEEETNI